MKNRIIPNLLKVMERKIERVPKGEEYWFIGDIGAQRNIDKHTIFDDRIYYNTGNYFVTQEEAISAVRKIYAVLKGADVIEMPSEEEFVGEFKKNGLGHSDIGLGFANCYHWLKSKIVK